ncbi:S-adenosyl-L-methionine-dependent methyltransferase [Leptodontidium sp. 2 PMI_412]|nr:S-adenosyl-L-methionine-dependent methyltransferase [Leptodontidium sp. 2 PMI_412]
MAEPQNVGLEAEADDYENDSALRGEGNASSTASINSNITKYREENGRTYHAYKDGKYQYPNDERENDRLNLQHHLCNLTFDGKLFTAPIPKEKRLHRVLDIGTGTGIWAIDFADEHPETKVLGVDLSPIQPSFIPPNLIFQINDLEEPWTFSEKFDFIYSRMMIGSVADFPRLFKQCFDNLSNGGWIETFEISFPVLLNDGEFPDNSALKKWSDLFMEGCEKLGRPANSAELYKSQLEAIGFVDVVETKYIWPSNRWPKDRKLKELGAWQLENLISGIEAFSMAIFTRVLGWTKLEVDIFLGNVKKEMKDTRIHVYWNIFVVYGHKPE